MCVCVYVCVFGGVASESEAVDEVREVCSSAGLCAVCFGLQSVWKGLPAKASKCSRLCVFKSTRCPGLKICQFNVPTEQEHCV